MKKYLYWAAVMLVRGALIFVGAVFCVPLGLVADGKYHTPRLWSFWGKSEEIPEWYFREKGSDSRWVRYKWMAWRNPTQGFQKFFSQPIPEVKPNPDQIVRGGEAPSAARKMEHGIYWEYWKLWRLKKPLFGKWPYWEIRIGWKFVDEKDGRDTFSPTIQNGPRR